MLANAESGARAVLEEGVDQEDCQGDGLAGGEMGLDDGVYELEDTGKACIYSGWFYRRGHLKIDDSWFQRITTQREQIPKNVQL